MSQETVSLKIADSTDKDIVCDLVEELYNYSSYCTVAEYSRKFVRESFILSLDKPDLCTILLRVNGTICGIVVMGLAPSPANPDIKFAVELAFWIQPEYRTRKTLRLLLGAYYHWARLQHCAAAYVGKISDTHHPETYYIRKL